MYQEVGRFAYRGTSTFSKVKSRIEPKMLLVFDPQALSELERAQQGVTICDVNTLRENIVSLTPNCRVVVGDSILVNRDRSEVLLEWLRQHQSGLRSNQVNVCVLKPSYQVTFTQENGDDTLLRIESLLNSFVLAGQTHLFTDENWAVLGNLAKDAFLKDLSFRNALECSERFRDVLNKSNQLDKVAPVLSSKTTYVGFCSDDYFKLDAEGKRVLSSRKAAFVLVAGGLGERLGSSQIKISLPTESLTHRSFLELFLMHLDTFSPPNPPPLCIMTSEDTQADTRKLLESMKRPFAIGKADSNSAITICKQEMVPCFLDKTGSIALKAPGKLLLKPHGHGDVHVLVHTACIAEWSKQGIEYVVFFQDTNPNCFRVLPSLLGAMSLTRSLDCAIACVPRVPGSATGCIASLSQGNKSTIENVEYNIMNTFLSKNPGLDEQFTLGNTNQMVVKMESYARVDPYMPEFCNPKYQPKSDSLFSSPARLECLMQDILRSFPADNVMPVLFGDFDQNKTKTHVLYAPAKNSLQVAQRAWDANTSDGSPASSEAAVYAGNCGLLIKLGCKVETDETSPVKFGQTMQILPLYPSVVFDPHVLPFFSDAATTLFSEPHSVFIGKHSSIEFRGPGKIICKRLYVEGSLLVWARNSDTVIELKDVRVVNSGRSVSAVEGDARIQVKHSDQLCVIEVSQPGITSVTRAVCPQ